MFRSRRCRNHRNCHTTRAIEETEKLKSPYRTHVEVGDLIEAVLGPGVEVMEPRVGRGVLS
jgi:hypothetical protein